MSAESEGIFLWREMRTRLLKRLRKDAVNEVKYHCGKYAFVAYSFVGKSECKYGGRIDSDENKTKIKAAIYQERRKVIMSFVRDMRFRKIMKEL